jgi:hypothetical protein
MSNGTYLLRGDQKYHTLRSKTFNLDNGSGTTDDDVIFADLPFDVYLESVKAIYVEATDTAGAASANFKLGTTAGGTGVVAATALEISKAVGSSTSATLASNRINAGTDLFARHTGIAATEAGQYYLQVVYRILP